MSGRVLGALWIVVGVAIWNGFFDLYVSRGAREYGQKQAEFELGLGPQPSMETVMSNALVPFYSTKRSGTGLGLALAREIIEAHGGRITISNRDGGGVAVGLVLPS